MMNYDFTKTLTVRDFSLMRIQKPRIHQMRGLWIYKKKIIFLSYLVYRCKHASNISHVSDELNTNASCIYAHIYLYMRISYSLQCCWAVYFMPSFTFLSFWVKKLMHYRRKNVSANIRKALAPDFVYMAIVPHQCYGKNERELGRIKAKALQGN